MEKLYIVTLWRHEDLDDLYREMEERGIVLDKKREMSRNTYYWMTQSQADELKTDSRIRNIELHPKELGCYVHTTYHPYTITDGNFYKEDSSSPTAAGAQNYRDWGKLFCAGTETQRGKGTWGSNNSGNEVRTESVTIFSDGRDVDVVVVDDRASYDCDEWLSPSTGQTRYVQYDWYEELRDYVPTLPFGSYNTSNYVSNSTNTNYHGTHVMSTIGGQHYGWAREANLYNLAFINIQSTVDQGEIFDILRAFHKNKPINSSTGRRNPTITNHSYGTSYTSTSFKNTYPNQLTQYVSEGVTYNSSNPGPNGWNAVGLSTDFNIDSRSKDEPAFTTAWNSDVEDAIRDGVVLIGAAGNSNYYQVDPNHPEYDDTMTFEYNDYNNKLLQGISDGYTLHSKRGMSPTANGMICVGAINQTRFNRRATFSNYGPGIHLYAPGTYILGAFRASGGTADSKYGGDNYYSAISGTSMASPQVAGVAACLASGRERFTQDDMLDYIEQYSWDVGSDGNTELSFNGEHNSGVGEYDRETTGTGTFSVKTFNINLCPHLAGITTALCAHYYPTLSNSSDSLYPAVTYFGSAHDRWTGGGTREEQNPQRPEDRVFQFWEGDRITVRYPPKYCMFDCSASNTTDGWCFSTPTRTPAENAPATDVIPSPVHWYDRSGRDYANTVTGNPTLNLIVGDILVIDTGSANSSHPFWIKSALGSGSTNALSGFYILNNGGQGTVSGSTGTNPFTSLANGQIVLHTQHLSAGTYYYQCGNHSGMNGEINLVTPATAFSSRRAFFKTARSQDSTSDLVTGTNNGDVRNQGNYGWDQSGITEAQTDRMSWQTRPGDAGTYFLQCESEPWAYEINIRPYPGAGSFNDLSCNKDGPTRFLRATSPRRDSGIVFTQTGRRNNSNIRMKYPRKSTIYRAQ